MAFLFFRAWLVWPTDIKFTNVQGNSFSVVWKTRAPTEGIVKMEYIGDDLTNLEKEVFFPDDRNLVVGDTEYESDHEVIDPATIQGKDQFTVHHATIQAPVKNFKLLINLEIIPFLTRHPSKNIPMSFSLPEGDTKDLTLPDNAFGSVYEDASMLDSEGVVLLRIHDEKTGTHSSLISTTLNNNSWSLDLNNADDNDGNPFMKGKDHNSEQIYHSTYLLLDNGTQIEKKVPIYADAPSKPFIGTAITEMNAKAIIEKLLSGIFNHTPNRLKVALSGLVNFPVKAVDFNNHDAELIVRWDLKDPKYDQIIPLGNFQDLQQIEQNSDGQKYITLTGSEEIEDFLSQLELIDEPSKVTILFQTEAPITPTAEIDKLLSEDSVQTENYATETFGSLEKAGFKVIWKGSRAMIDEISDENLNILIKNGLDGIVLQEQNTVGETSISLPSRVQALERSANRYTDLFALSNRNSPNIIIQLSHEKCLFGELENCSSFIKEAQRRGYDDLILLSSLPIEENLYEELGYSSEELQKHVPQLLSPYQSTENSVYKGISEIYCYQDSKSYKNGEVFYKDGLAQQYCFGGTWENLSIIAHSDICPINDYCICSGTDMIITKEEPNRRCEKEQIFVSANWLESGRCIRENACKGKKPGFAGCIDTDQGTEYISCSSTCTPSWGICEEEYINKIAIEEVIPQGESESRELNDTDNFFTVSGEGDFTEISISPTNGLVIFPSPGRYCLTIREKRYCFRILSTKNNLLYIDKNGDSVYDPQIDENVAEDAETLQLEQSDTEIVYQFKRGLNLISMNGIPPLEKFTASQFLEVLNSSPDGEIVSIHYFNNGEWKGITWRGDGDFVGDDFPISPGRGYMVRASSDMEVVYSGKILAQAVPIYFTEGWNLVGFNGTLKPEITGKEIISRINRESSLNSETITRWDSSSSQYKSFQFNGIEAEQQYGFDFLIDQYEGYFVRINSGNATWRP